ncbi:MAG: lysophospholipid acyltransferase family protein [Aquabacterium sp.]|nr:MAG: lysophospholipid acyltransferase family protein [Aquabacterium sp.]TAL22060.1 MAG: lysophospholipid acyltransferase family protein [Aquabacterium sp.]
MSIFLRALAHSPLWLLHGLGVALGWLTYALSPTYRTRLKANARAAGVPAAGVRAAVAQAGKMAAELPVLWLRPRGELLGGRLSWTGTEHVEAAIRAGRGVLYLTPHLGCFEVTAQALAERFGDRMPLTVLYRPARKAWLRQWMEGSRDRPGMHAVPTTLAGVRQMIRALRKGESIGLLPDQVPPQGQGEWAPFFGRPAYTMTLAARLAQQTGAQVLLIWGERLPWGRGFRVHVTPPPAELQDLLVPGGEGQADPAQSAAAINRAMEALILQRPEQYLWGYHRYKEPKPQPASAVAGEAA